MGLQNNWKVSAEQRKIPRKASLPIIYQTKDEYQGYKKNFRN